MSEYTDMLGITDKSPHNKQYQYIENINEIVISKDKNGFIHFCRLVPLTEQEIEQCHSQQT